MKFNPHTDKPLVLLIQSVVKKKIFVKLKIIDRHDLLKLLNELL